jgi:tetratricopeptide (TPR) repeat protein
MNETPDTFDLAVSHHRAGRLDEAGRLYGAILSGKPDHFGALHHLGLIASQRGRLKEAEALLRRALAANPNATGASTDLGIVLARQGRVEDAMAAYRRALALDPANVEAHNNLGAALQSLDRLDEAVAEFRTALALRPNHPALHNNLGIALNALGRTEEALAAHEKAVAINPRFTDAQNNLGNALVKLGRHDEALIRLYRALDLTPDAAETHNALAVALLPVKAWEEALVHLRRAIELKADFAEPHNNAGLALVGLKRYDEAIPHFRRTAELKPDLAETPNNLGNALAGLKRHDEAVTEYRRALERRPDFIEAHNNVGNSLSALKRHAEAVPHYRRALEAKPDFAEAHGNLAMALTALNRHAEAVPHYERAIALQPDLAEVHSGYGNQLMILGRLDEARREVERAIALAPGNPGFYRNIVVLKRFRADDPQLEAMQALARNGAALTDEERMNLHFALGKAQADIGRHDAAFRHFLEANTLKRRQTAYNEAATLDQLKRIAAVFTPDLMRRLQGCGDPTTLPVFIVGMPRCGSTLVEQVIASHPAVFGAGEIGDFEAAVAAVDGSPVTPRLPETVAALSGEQLRRIGADYRQRIAALAPDAQRITDKMLMNFRFVGAIHLALPQARIIHVRRDPADTCLSSFCRLFGGELSFTYDLAELGRYYRAYAELMAHWRAVLPEGAMLEVQYEDFVTDFPAQARRLIAYCGLEWDERCSAFHQTDRPVTTSSATQVRQPLFRDSMGAWRPYKELLQPLLEHLDRL